MWNGKNKAFTFSFDDGVKQDERMIEILDRYGLRATFNINSAYLGTLSELNCDGRIVRHDKVRACDVKKIYRNHEVAAHTLTHPNLTELDESTVIRQVEEDRKELESLCGKRVRGMAYPCGGVNNDERVAEIIAAHTGIEFARTILSTYSFDLQKNLFRFNPTLHNIEKKQLFLLAEKFIDNKSEKPQLFYAWGHTYEMDAGYISWDELEEFCKMISGRGDIFYGTNSEVLLDR